MAGSPGQDMLSVLFAALALGILLLLTIFVAPLFIVGVPAYFIYRVYTESPARAERLAKAETHALYQHALAGSVLLSEEAIDAGLAQSWPSNLPYALRLQLLEVGRALFAQEGLSPYIPPPPAICNSVEAARYRDMLAKMGTARHDRLMMETALAMISDSLATIAKAVPPLAGDTLVSVTQFLHPLGAAVEGVITPFFAENDYHLFKPLRDTLNHNLSKTHRTAPVFPREYKGDDVVDAFLTGTPLRALFDLKTPFCIPEAQRFEHMHIVAGSGHGKTQTLQYLISQDLDEIARGEKSVIVIDSQGDLIRTILSACALPPDRIVLINPEDIGYPVSLNLFSVGQDRLLGYSDLERERLTNSIIELYDFVLGSLLSAGMTSKQNVVFRYVTRLMFHIPEATIHTLRDLMEPGGSAKYHEYINRLDTTARRFFATEFDSKEFTNTKAQVLRRLYGVLENQTFERMFSHPQSKFDMFTEMNKGKLILINTAKSLLKEQGTEILGRFFVALIAQAAQERATLPTYARLPCFVYVDEAQDYFDENIGIILSQARKYQVGMVLAHQYLGQLGSALQEGIEANTSIKLAGGVSARDARTLAGQFGVDPGMIERQQKGSFATYIRGLTQKAVPVSFPFFVLEKRARASQAELDAIVTHSRECYAEPLPTKDCSNPKTNTEEQAAPDQNDPPDPLAPSAEL